MYSVRPGSYTNVGETPEIGESPPNQPISGLTFFLVYIRPFPEHSSSIATFSAGRAWLEAILSSDQVVLGCSCSSSCRNFRSKVSCFSLSASCHGSHRDQRQPLVYLDFLDENEPLDGAELISDDDGSAIVLSSDVGLEISGTEGESEAKLSDGKS